MLKTLNVSNNALNCLPSELGNLTALTQIDFANNDISKVPSEVSSLLTLSCLSIVIWFQSLMTVNSDAAKLQATVKCLLPLRSQVCNLPQLEILNLMNNRIKSLPGKIGALKSLRILGLKGNLIEDLPESFGELESLKV
jgi:Leucine-rich repeat (LRR) protein